MAYYYYLEAEFGTSQAAAVAFAAHFKDFKFKLKNGLKISVFSNFQSQDEEGNWRCTIIPSGVSLGVPNREYERLIESHEQLEEITLTLYDHLESAPPFRYAHTQWEIEERLNWSELMSDRDSFSDPNQKWYDGLVLSDEIWKQAGSPPVFVPFAPGYLWRPYSGATYW
ncbi:hypothetical protein EON80_27450 [bacterium]|nr:MAG: hypothetical protein EON80_27450 [bacterium]